MEIKPKTKLLDLLNQYPELEPKVISMAPPFKNLKNPVLRKTVGKLATLDKVAKIGGVDLNVFINELRLGIGLEVIQHVIDEVSISLPDEAPIWIKGKPKQIIDGTAMLEAGGHPLKYINKLMNEIQSGEFVLLKTNFPPLPMHDAMSKQNYLVYYNVEGDQHQSFFGKQ
ncbi:MAG: DUF1858 domain-containing protein [Candidatus Marinimicrobia bacterium]|jgi:hypothetical protein|nr:DUF1858 domain-containing protein [Candidatus Neomarinimicrobiota bacterium]MBT3501320.1 DUF1858 domain-containing protein [Candidatus Neomarinimicrobiota bacterium]MBT3838520.1 DUF1858 domain-containing protein [Candidatus Neomarinimicrobiota bacterium]MBT3999902.1 DUF1858 domain-containing protein [Candidatus Neomarinimicrobiota bacterium]MBT4282551.1 DUF1858 domain-containing protein [Candidatus Neomarinimicrobiota bacterium]